MKNKHSEKIIEEIVRYSMEQGINQWFIRSPMGSQVKVDGVNSANFKDVIRAMFKDSKKLITRLLPYVELGSIGNIITIIDKHEEFLRTNFSVMKSLLETNEKSIMVFSGQKKKIYNQLKAMYDSEQINELENLFFSDIKDESRYQTLELDTCSFGFDLTVFVDSYPSAFNFYTIEDNFLSFINYLSGSLEVREMLGVEAITYINGKDDYVYIVMLAPKDRAKVKFFFSELIERFPRFDMAQVAHKNNDLKKIFVDTILLDYAIPSAEGAQGLLTSLDEQCEKDNKNNNRKTKVRTKARKEAKPKIIKI